MNHFNTHQHHNTASHAAPQAWQHGLIVMLLICWGPAYRALLDKLWVWGGGLSLVGQWAQLQAAADLVGTPAFAGIVIGLTVLTAQKQAAQHTALLLAGFAAALLCTTPMLLALLCAPARVGQWLQLSPALQGSLPLAGLVGWLGIVYGLLSGYWLGRKQHGRVLLLSIASGAPALLALGASGALAISERLDLFLRVGVAVGMLGSLALAGVGLRWYLRTPQASVQLRDSLRLLLRYVPAGLSIGLLTPLSGLVIRSTLASQVGWDATGSATALWRASDWVLSGAAGVLYFHYLPWLSQQVQHGSVWPALRHIARRVTLPGAVALLALFALQHQILPALYSEQLALPWHTTALFWAGDALRIASATLLYALYALHASKAIAWGEWLSQPLLAALLLLGAAQSLPWTGAAHVVTYFVSAGFNFWAVRKFTDPQSQPLRASK